MFFKKTGNMTQVPGAVMHLIEPTTLPNKKPLDEMKEESEKVGLKLNIQKTKIMASGPITSWQIDG